VIIARVLVIAMLPCALAAQTATFPTQPGQAAYGAISEIVRLLEADPKTDWSRVNVEALRQHLIDMDEVTTQAAVVQRDVPGGVVMDVTGAGRTVDAIQRMVSSHMHALDQTQDYQSSAEPLPNGLRATVTARNAADAGVVARIRGLGFAGLMTEGAHHALHHLALARGDTHPHGH
jgi:hypothetical protein